MNDDNIPPLPREIYCMIIARLPVEEQARCRRVCRQFSDWFSIQNWAFVYNTYSSGHEEFPHLEYTLKRVVSLDPSKWHWHALVRNSTIPDEFWIKYHDTIKEDKSTDCSGIPSAWILCRFAGMRYISQCIEVDERFSDLKLDLSFNQNLSLEFIERVIQKYGIHFWAWGCISRNLRIIIQAIEIHPEWPWRLDFVLENEHLTTSFLEQHFHEFENFPNKLGAPHPAMTRDLVARHIHSNIWNWSVLSANRIFTMDFVEQHLDWPWVGSGLMRNIHITHDFMTRHPEFRWDWEEFSHNYPMTQEWLRRYGYTPGVIFWDACRELYLTEDLIAEFFIPPKDGTLRGWRGDWEEISKHPIVLPDIVERHLDWPWAWDFILENPSVNWAFIYKHLDKFEEEIRNANQYIQWPKH